VAADTRLPFIAEDNSRRIVSTAVINYVSLGPLTDGDPMSRVKDVIGMIESNMLENEGAAFGALLNIGGRRVCDLLIPLRDSLDRDAINNAVNCSTGFIYSATADFYLNWLEGMEGTDQDRSIRILVWRKRAAAHGSQSTYGAFMRARIPITAKATQAKQRSVKRLKRVPVSSHNFQIKYSWGPTGRKRATSTAGKLPARQRPPSRRRP
jgi:hypothetical protein